MKILFITSNFPYPPITGGKIRTGSLLRQIGRCHEVTLLSLLDSAGEQKYITHLLPYCKRIETVVKQRHRPRGRLFLKLLHTMLKGAPPRMGIAHYEAMAKKIQEVTGGESFDIIHLDETQTAPYIEYAHTGSAARIVTLHDIGAMQYERMLKAETSWGNRFWTFLNLIFLRKWEPSYVARCFDCCIVVSDVDAEFLRKMSPSIKTRVVPNGVDAAAYQALPELSETPQILYIGKMNYPPNVDAALFFCREIFPRIKQSIPDVKLTIIGQGASKLTKLVACEDVTVTGFVESVVPYYQQCMISVVPLRAGGGTRLKILEAMAFGRPVVSTTVGCEGLTVTNGKDLLIADTAEEFAAQSINLLKDPELRRSLALNGRKLVETAYDWSVIGPKMLGVFEEAYALKKIAAGK